MPKAIRHPNRHSLGEYREREGHLIPLASPDPSPPPKPAPVAPPGRTAWIV